MRHRSRKSGLPSGLRTETTATCKEPKNAPLPFSAAGLLATTEMFRAALTAGRCAGCRMQCEAENGVRQMPDLIAFPSGFCSFRLCRRHPFRRLEREPWHFGKAVFDSMRIGCPINFRVLVSEFHRADYAVVVEMHNHVRVLLLVLYESREIVGDSDGPLRIDGIKRTVATRQ